MKRFGLVALLVVLGSAPASVFAQLPGEPKPPQSYDPVGSMEYNAKLWQPDARVREAQQALRDQGYYQGPLDGLLTPEFRSAIWNFQRAKGLLKTARLDAPTMAALDLQAPGAASPRAPEGFGGTSRPPRSHDVEAP